MPGAPPEHETTVWWLRTPRQEPPDDGSTELLSGEEHLRAGRYRHSRDAAAFVRRRAMLRQVLGARLCVPPESVGLRTTGQGKPVLDRSAPSATPLWFSCAHTAELAVVAVTTAAPVGVDVEDVPARVDVDEAAGLVLTPAEGTALTSAPRAHRELAFLRLWTAKEAYTKAVGHGLTVDPTAVEVRQGRVGPAGRRPWGRGAAPVAWRAADGHLVAVVLLTADPPRLRWRALATQRPQGTA